MTPALNSPTTAMKYPGLGLPLRDFPQDWGNFYPMGAHGNCIGGHSELLPVREVAMMSIMNKLTDKENWHEKVYSPEAVEKWRQESLSIRDDVFWREISQKQGGTSPLIHIITSEVFDYCIQELREKAEYYKTTGITPTLDATACVAKSDTLVDFDLYSAVRQAFEDLIEEQAASPDWHPGSADMVQDLVHPSMYPLVYGESKVMPDEVVGVQDAVDKWAGKGQAIELPSTDKYLLKDYVGPGNDAWDLEGYAVPPGFWSEKYQWLPANIKFDNNGSAQFTSYINNLHPIKHVGIYRTIEKLIDKAIPMWDQCLATAKQTEESYGRTTKAGPGRTSSRFSSPNDPNDDVKTNWIPSDPEECKDALIDMALLPRRYRRFGTPETLSPECKWELLRKPALREPDKFRKISYTPTPGQRLAEKFKESGLQVIVKMASIELDPSKPIFPTGAWHGQMNERICATALFYVDEENIEPSSLSFRMQTPSDSYEDFGVEQNQYSWLSDVYGTSLSEDGTCLQKYGTVQTPQGRMLAFPNVFQHSVSSFGLEDPTEPGHRRFVAIWLVDPHTRIVSTANVPPQQQSWWKESTLGPKSDAAISKLPPELAQLLQEQGLLPQEGITAQGTSKLPAELLDMVRGHFEAPVMTEQAAKEHREELMAERTSFLGETEDWWNQHTYNFCEH